MNRHDALARLAEGRLWDVLVIGGGASGLGAALEAATRGYRTLLVEQADFAQATSSRSTKLVHGGVRYLQQGNLTLVREALRERALLLENAPGLAQPLSLIIPLQSRWEQLYLGAGLKMYDLLAGWRGVGASRFLPPDEMRARLPGFTGPASHGGLLFHDGQFDDARLAIALARTLFAHGGAALNYARVVQLRKQEDRVCGAIIEDRETGTRHEIWARTVINATGVFTDSIRQMDAPAPPSVTPSQGIHLVLPRKYLAGDAAILIPKSADGRVLFAIPWQGRVLLGTTDTPVREPDLEPRALPQEIEFLLDHARRFLGWHIAPAEVLSVYAGLRPLAKTTGGARTAALSRDHVITVSPTGLISITGGKWTTYRLMGEHVIDRAAAVGRLAERPSITAQLRLEIPREPDGEPLDPALPLNRAQIVHAAREEMARTLEDLLSRRTRALILDARAAMRLAPQAAEIMGAELGWDEKFREVEVARFCALARNYLL